MRHFLRVLFNLLATYKWSDQSPWDEEDSMRLKQVLSGDFGVRLITRLRNASIVLNSRAVQDGKPWACGQASGYMLALADIQALSGSGDQSNAADTEDSGEGIPEGLEHMSP